MKRKADHSLDIRGGIVPYALLKASQAFGEMSSGETMEIFVGDPDVREDLFKVLPAAGYQLIKIEYEKTFCRILLKKEVPNEC